MQSGDGFVYCYDSLYRLLFFSGVITFRLDNQSNGGPRSTTRRVLYAVGARFGMALGFIGGVYVKLTDPEMSQAMFSRLTPLIKLIFTWEFLSCLTTYTVLCLALDTLRKQHIQLLTGMQRLDTEIWTQFQHVHWRYDRSRAKYWYGTVAVTSCYVVTSLALMFDTTRCSCGYVSTILIASTYAMITSTLGVMGFIHIGQMDYLRLRFRLIMRLVDQIYVKADWGKLTGGLLKDLEKRMDLLFEFTKSCSQLLSEMNQVCGGVAAAGLFYDFTHMTCFFYMLCQKLLNYEAWDVQYAFISLHLCVHVYKVLMTSIYGYLLRREKRNCLRLLSTYNYHFGSEPAAKQKVEDFQLWRMHNDHGPVIGKSHPCNISFLYQVLNALANYVIILVQLLFQLQAKDKNHGYGTSIPKDVELIKSVEHLTHFNDGL